MILMKKINQYIIEKLKIDRNTSSQIPKDFKDAYNVLEKIFKGLNLECSIEYSKEAKVGPLDGNHIQVELKKELSVKEQTDISKKINTEFEEKKIGCICFCGYTRDKNEKILNTHFSIDNYERT